MPNSKKILVLCSFEHRFILGQIENISCPPLIHLIIWGMTKKHYERTQEVSETVSQRIVQNFFSGIPGGQLEQLADAAPDMLNLLRVLGQVFNHPNFTDRGGYGESINRIIAKAEGK